MPADMKTVLSSHVWKIGYDAETKDLAVQYVPDRKYPAGRVVTYHDVPPDTAEDVIHAPSVGQALIQSIKGSFSFSG